MTAIIEWRIPLMLAKDNRYQLQLVPFVDTGTSWEEDQALANTEKETITSAGLGVLWDPKLQWHLELFYGYALEDLALAD